MVYFLWPDEDWQVDNAIISVRHDLPSCPVFIVGKSLKWRPAFATLAQFCEIVYIDLGTLL